MSDPTTLHIALIYLAAINVATFFVYGIDKYKARKSRWRISEAALLLLAVLGGSIGAWLGMKVWHHKTLHKKFQYGVPLILIAQVVLVLLVACSPRQAAALTAEPETHVQEEEEIPAPLPRRNPRHDIGSSDSLIKLVGHTTPGTPQEHSTSVFLIMYDSEVGKEPLLKAIEEYGCEIVYDYSIITGMALKKPENKTLEETMEYFRKVKGVTNVEYDKIYRLDDPVKPKLETE